MPGDANPTLSFGPVEGCGQHNIDNCFDFVGLLSKKSEVGL